MNGDRIINAIEAAGGTTEKADLTKVNLAFILSDGCRVRIPSVDEKNENYCIVSSASGENIVNSNDGNKNKNNNNSNVNNVGVKNGGKININTASQTELESLTGIGPSIASKIIEYRKINGKFKKIEEIKNVSGVGEEKYNGLKNEICIK